MWPKYSVIIHARHNAFGTREAFSVGMQIRSDENGGQSVNRSTTVRLSDSAATCKVLPMLPSYLALVLLKNMIAQEKARICVALYMYTFLFWKGFWNLVSCVSWGNLQFAPGSV